MRFARGLEKRAVEQSVFIEGFGGGVVRATESEIKKESTNGEKTNRKRTTPRPLCTDSSSSLLDSDTLGEVTWHIDVGSAGDRHVVGKKLERNDVEETLEAVDGLGHSDHVSVVVDGCIGIVGDDDGST